jgi:hypothetical protein
VGFSQGGAAPVVVMVIVVAQHVQAHEVSVEHVRICPRGATNHHSRALAERETCMHGFQQQHTHAG